VRSPKLYYFDVGIAAYLMGITDMRQIAAHPLRGLLFENMAVVEAMKYALNRGRRPTLHFYRDAEGNEIDLLFSSGTRTIPIEVKSAVTFDPGWLRAFDHVPAKVVSPDTPKLIVYGGEDRDFGDVRAISVFRLPSVLDELLGA
jgi:predicted AAA+ superfamily ATPase